LNLNPWFIENTKNDFTIGCKIFPKGPLKT